MQESSSEKLLCVLVDFHTLGVYLKMKYIGFSYPYWRSDSALAPRRLLDAGAAECREVSNQALQCLDCLVFT